jgi:hypothetical protein
VVTLWTVTLAHVLHDSGLFVVNPPLTLAVYADEDGGLHADDDALGLYGYGATPAALQRDLADEIAFVWRAYAQGDPMTMTHKAQLLGAAVRQRVRFEPAPNPDADPAGC